MASIIGRVEAVSEWDRSFPGYYYDYFTAPQDQFQRCTERWVGQEANLERVLQAIISDNRGWQSLLPPPKTDLPVPNIRRLGEGMPHVTGAARPYERDLRGTYIHDLQIPHNNHALEALLLDYCRLANCQFNFKDERFPVGMGLWQLHVKSAKFDACVFENAHIFTTSLLEDCVFADCTFRNVIFNRNLDSVYKRLFFLNCTFEGVDLTRVNINSWCFWGNCNFSNVAIATRTIDPKRPVGADILDFCRTADETYHKSRRRLRPPKRTMSREHGLQIEDVKLAENEPDEPYINGFEQRNCHEGLANFYVAMADTAFAKRAAKLSVHFEYRYAWHIDEIDLLNAEGWRARFQRIKNAFARHVLGYGVNFTGPLRSWGIMVATFPLFYMFLGIRVLNAPVRRELSWDPHQAMATLHDYWYCLYFSAITATTVGFGDAMPTGWSRIFTMIEATAAAVLLPVFGVTLVRRYLRK